MRVSVVNGHGEPTAAAGTTAPRPAGTDCAVVVVTYRSAADLRGLLDSVPAAAGGLRVTVTVVDNDSRDDVADVVAHRDGVRLVRAAGNLGYAGGINLAYRHLPASRWVLVLNPDLVLDPGAIETMVDCAERSGAGAVVPRMLDTDGSPSPSLRREPRVSRTLGEALLGDVLPGRPAWAAEMVREPEAYDHEHAVEWATGAALLVSRSAVESVGAWDPRFFLYSEETDYCRRLRSAGWEIRYTPDAVARHRGGGSGTSPDLVALLAVNRVRYARKWHGPPTAATAWSIGLLHCSLRLRDPGQRRALAALVSRRVRRRLPGAASAAAAGGAP